MSLIVLEFLCPKHGRFELIVERSAAPDEAPCPAPDEDLYDWRQGGPLCDVASPWVVSAPKIKVKYATAATMAKSDPAPSPLYMNTEPLADGMPQWEFDEKRARVWDNWRDEKIKKAVG